MSIRVTVEDIETGDGESAVIGNDYIVTCAGTCHVAHIQTFGNGTHVLTIKGRQPARPSSSEEESG